MAEGVLIASLSKMLFQYRGYLIATRTFERFTHKLPPKHNPDIQSGCISFSMEETSNLAYRLPGRILRGCHTLPYPGR